MKQALLAAVAAAALVIPALAAGPASANAIPDRAAIVETYADIAQAMYEDALIRATELDAVIDTFLAAPDAAGIIAAREAWLLAREPYQQTEVYRFGNAIVDDWEGKVNAWPLDEGLIDYVDVAIYGEASDENPLHNANVIANETIVVGAETIDASVIDTALLSDQLHEVGAIEANVATGYHAIEFLLWGQDLNGDGTPGFGGRDTTAGIRSYTDYLPEGAGCTNGSCTRRGEYLLAAADLLTEDLERVAAAWNPNGGVHYGTFTAGGKVSLAKILEGMGRLGFGELAGERMNIALVANSQEDEHSCFSDNTHRDILLDALSIQNAYLGRYTRIDGTLVSGPSPDALLRAQGDTGVADAMAAALADTMAKVGVIDTRAKDGVPFDVQIQEGIEQPDIQAAIRALRDQIPPLEAVIEALGVTTGDLCQDTEEFECE